MEKRTWICVGLQVATASLELSNNHLEYSLSDEHTVIWRGRADALCKPTGKSGTIQYAITFRIKDDLIVSCDEMTNSGAQPLALSFTESKRSSLQSADQIDQLIGLNDIFTWLAAGKLKRQCF